ncbi:hypothetical protein SEUCBS140593_005881 [Sporothrix eucalyptigena]|uniref:Uncharacterized protein n=1 Tax=Sporothrix eucalyptigena TaxID=1812306 RepID=A0ABP0C061_9PEZI
MALRRSATLNAGPDQLNPWRPFTKSSFEIYRNNLSSIICGLSTLLPLLLRTRAGDCFMTSADSQ